MCTSLGCSKSKGKRRNHSFRGVTLRMCTSLGCSKSRGKEGEKEGRKKGKKRGKKENLARKFR
jgi:hypothetical protein